MPNTTLIDELRRRIKDTSFAVTAMTISCTDSSVTSASLEITHGRLVFTPVGGTVQPIDIDLTSPAYLTVGRVFEHLSRISGVTIQLSEDADREHLCSDFEEIGPVDVRQQGVGLRHHLFSDWELEQAVIAGIRLHNPAMAINTLPVSENELVLLLSQAIIARARAADAAKRKGTQTPAMEFLWIAQSHETAYDQALRRLSRAVVPIKEAPEGSVEEGDIMMGTQWRRSARTGFLAPLGVAQPPPAPQLLEPGDEDEEDENVRITWKRSEDKHFHSYELWKDTQPLVHRQRENVLLSGLPTAGPATAFDTNAGAPRPSTADLVFRSFGASSNFSTVGFSTFIESYGQLVVAFNVPNLEPDTDYYFRLYVTDLNYNTVASNVVQMRTKALRCRFDPTTPLSVTTGAPGTSVTVTFDSTKGTFTSAHRLEFGGKTVAATIVDPYHVTFTVPAFVHTEDLKKVVVVSPTGLKDILFDAFKVTS